MGLSGRNVISIIELVIYGHIAPVNIYLCIKHGFGPNSGWIFLLLFTLIRCTGASENLASVTFSTNIPLQTSAALLSTVGLSPLLFTTLGLLIRVNQGIKKTYPTHVETKYIRLLRLPIIAALALAVVGGIDSANAFTKTGTYPISVFTKIAIPILTVVFVTVAVLTSWLVCHRRFAELAEQRIAVAVAASLPYLLVRLIYMILVTFCDNGTFNVLDGSMVAFGCMSVLQEIYVVIIYVVTGIALPKFVKEQTVKRGQSRVTRAKEGFARVEERIPRGCDMLNGSTHLPENHKQYAEDGDGGHGTWRYEISEKELRRILF